MVNNNFYEIKYNDRLVSRNLIRVTSRVKKNLVF